MQKHFNHLNCVSFSTAGFEPHAEMHTAHHMLLFGCPAPAEVALANDGKFWYVYNDNCILLNQVY